MTAIGGHHKATSRTETWLTPPWILAALGDFDLDPCAAEEQPKWAARRWYTRQENGLNQPWAGRVWLNPPYGAKVAHWLKRLADHGNGIALIFARTETEMFFEHVWAKAGAVLFFEGRLHFHFADGRASPTNAGAPSVLVAYGSNNVEVLRTAPIAGCFLELGRNAV